jgi:cupin fold WbuC family metalloprotein
MRNMKLKRIKIENKLTFFNKKKYNLINTSFFLKEFRKKSNKKIKRIRICLHKNEKSKVQESIIATKGFNYFRAHKHPGKITESYHVIKGKIVVCILNSKNGNVIHKIVLDENNSKKINVGKMFHISPNIYHLVLPISKFAIYHEVAHGPFSKNSKFLIYLKNSPLENEKILDLKNYCQKKTNIKFNRIFKN